ncbi:TRAP transporter small permease [Desulfovibrio ferrophilus]|uniref:Tripartite AtP-independent periplasmic transporter subunit DctQ n=1 Tax=Desulfovibrio ferrophilus TaxID=241368 RepID=A0A2Z6B2V7_9BACT|nr:TRAP transporter small permease subunit [Desulfovibrio ferrophilus]BBD09775.1 tripartite AtP-independent periplasmic transporter subunit DctQ [Desulfovibrio ferrophilus]
MSPFASLCKKASDVLERLCLIGAGVLLVVNLADVMLGVFGRFYRPPMWTMDLAKITLVWMVMLAAAPALKRGEHMAIEIIVNKLPENMRWLVIWLRRIVFVCVLGAMIILGFQYAYKLRMLTIMTLGIKKAIPLLAIPVGMSLMLLEYTLGQFIPPGAPENENLEGGTS